MESVITKPSLSDHQSYTVTTLQPMQCNIHLWSKANIQGILNLCNVWLDIDDVLLKQFKVIYSECLNHVPTKICKFE